MNQGIDRVSWSTTLAFGAPAIGAGYMYLILSLYVMKFSTDVLLIAPAVMGSNIQVCRAFGMLFQIPWLVILAIERPSFG